MGIFVFWIGFSLLIGYMATQRGRGQVEWTFVALLISPLIAFIVLVVMPNLKDEETKVEVEAERQREIATRHQEAQQQQLIQQNTVNTDSFIERLEKFAKLYHHDMLTDEEFRDRKNAAISELTQKRLSKPPEDFLYDIINLRDTGVLDDSDMNRIKTIVL